MRYIPLVQVIACAPANWVANSVGWKNRVNQADNKSEEITAIGNKWSALKRYFVNAFGDKCWYTEAPRIGTDNDVDHFRPKAGAKMKNGKTAERIFGEATVKHKGYWWLAYEVSNYRYSCIFANRLRVGGGKGEYFPLEDENTRVWSSAVNVVTEKISLIDPCVKADVQLIKFDHLPGYAVSKYDATTNPVDYERFNQSKKIYNFNEASITKARLARVDSIKKDLDLLENCWALPVGIQARFADSISSAESSIVSACDRKSDFSAAVVSLVKTKKIEPWFANVLTRVDLTP